MNLITALTGPGEPEIGCDECFDSLDVYVELTLAGRNADERVPGMRAHLRRVPRLPRGLPQPVRARR